jgi:predicted nucleic acid-binding protein
VIYADTSAVVRAYIVDEPGHPGLANLIVQAQQPVLTSEITRIEFAGAVVRAERAGRIRMANELIRLFDRQSRSGTGLALVPLHRVPILDSAQHLASKHGLGALDSIHLAVALDESERIENEAERTAFVFVTRDRAQAAAAQAEGLTVV